MPEIIENREGGDNAVWYLSDADILDVREEDTQPLPTSECSRKWAAQKYGRTTHPTNGNPESSTDTPKR